MLWEAAVLALLVRAAGAADGRAGSQSQQLRALAALLPSFLTDHFTELAKVAAASCEVLPLDYLFSRNYTFEMSGMQVVEMTRQAARALPAARAASRLPHWPLDGSSTLCIYVPGWMNTPEDESSRSLSDALLQKHAVVLIFNTTETFGRDYVTSASKVKGVAHVLFGLIRDLFKRGFPLQSIHLLGFSLGSHVIGVAGKLVQKWLNRKLPKITALDPAHPCFGPNTKTKLMKDDAKFVHVIHTSAVVGVEKPIGHVDVYANGVGVPQPECMDLKISLECDHARAWKLYSASVVSERSVLGRECRTWRDLKRGACNAQPVPVGYGVSPRTRGLFLYRSPLNNRRSEHKRQVQVQDPFDFFASLFS